MNGLASLPTKRFDNGGRISGPMGAIGSLGGLNDPIASIGPVSITPVDIAAAVIGTPVAAGINYGLNALTAANQAMTAQQAPAPISVAQAMTPAETVAAEEAANAAAAAAQAQAGLQAAIDEANTTQDSNVGMSQQEQAEAALSALSEAISEADATQDSNAGMAAAAVGTSDSGGGGGGGGGTAGVGDESGHSADGNNSGGGGGDPDGNGTGEGGGWYKGGQIMNYAQGGVAAAKHAQSMGRGNDTMLVHMTPGEVGGLQALAKAGGGSLTINPNTGLPEAGFLSAMLPMVAGAALAPFTGGMSAALLVGAGYTAATGSLKKGLMAGLGAFGGANIASGLGAAGGVEGVAGAAPEIATAATPATSAATTLTPEMLTTTGAGDVSLANLPSVQYPATAMPTGGEATFTLPGGDVTYASQYAGPQLSPQGGYTGMGGIPAPEVVQAPPPVTEGYGNARDALLARGEPTGGAAYMQPAPVRPTYEQMGKGIENIMDQGKTGEAARKAFGDKVGYGTLASAAAPILTQEPEPMAKKSSYIRRYDVDVANQSGLGSTYAPGSSYERQMVDYSFSPRPVYQAATGGLAALAKGGETSKKKSKKVGGDEYYKFAQDRRDSSMQGAIDANFAAGGQPRFLSGGGDGMSDDIPATIDGKQPARLADGEFVVPADVVSHLGNGSSKAGAKKLYKMMDRIRQARTGKKSQAPEVKSERYMPA